MDTIYFVQFTDAFSRQPIIVRVDQIHKVEEYTTDEYTDIRKITYIDNQECDYVVDSMDEIVCILNGGGVE